MDKSLAILVKRNYDAAQTVEIETCIEIQIEHRTLNKIII